MVVVLVDTLESCAEADRILTLFQYRPLGLGFSLTTLPVRIAPDAPAFPVREGETWGDVAPRLKEAGPAVRFVRAD